MRTVVLCGALGALAPLAACETLPEPSTAVIEEAAPRAAIDSGAARAGQWEKPDHRQAGHPADLVEYARQR